MKQQDARGYKPEADGNAAAGYVIARVVDVTEFHGDQALQLWDDDVHRTEAAALHHHAENVDEAPELWQVYGLRPVAESRYVAEPES